MTFTDFHYFSNALGVQVSVFVLMPPMEVMEQKKTKLPCLYLLHGLSDDHTMWMRQTCIEQIAKDYRVCIVMPAVNRSFYMDMAHGAKYDTFIAEELPRIIETYFPVGKKREHRFAAGLSMGGYGAMKLALTFPERFGAAASFSGAADIVTMSERKSADWKRIFGRRKVEGTDCDLFHLMEKNASAPHKPRLYVSCGTADFLYGQHKKFIPALKKAGWDVTSYEEPDATHEWGFWDREIRKFIEFIYNK